jgi:hypothetical protein
VDLFIFCRLFKDSNELMPNVRLEKSDQSEEKGGCLEEDQEI